MLVRESLGNKKYSLQGSVNTLRPRQNGRRFADDTFKHIFLNENVRISIKISLKFVPKGPINNIPALVQIMACRRSGDKPISEPMMVSLLTHICVTRPQWVKTPRVCYDPNCRYRVIMPKGTGKITLYQLIFVTNMNMYHFYLIQCIHTRWPMWLISILWEDKGAFQKHELVNLGAHKSSLLNKLHIFQCMGKIFCVEFQRVPLKSHTKYLTHAFKDTTFMKCWKFKSSQINKSTFGTCSTPWPG